MLDMDKEGRYTLLIIVVALIAIALAASTIASVAEPAGGSDRIQYDVVGPESSQSNQSEINDSIGEGEGSSSRGSSVKLTRCIDVLTTPLAIGGMLAGLGLILLGIYRRFNIATAMFSSFVLFPVMIGTWAMLTNCVSGTSGSDGMIEGGDFLSNEGNALVSSPPVSPTLLAMVFGGLVVVSVAVMLTVTGRDETYEPIEEDDVEPDEAEFARAAGRAADRIERGNAAVDNAVYRAWSEMTNLLDVPDRDTAAPMDFAEAAIELGLDEDDVAELTELFNEVRYGHRSAEDREERAVEILRHIEETYEGDDAFESMDEETT